VTFVRRLVFALAGPVGVYVVAVNLFAVGLLIAGRDVTDEGSMRVVVDPRGPAAAAGMHDGDRIVSVDGAPTPDWAALRTAILSQAGRKVRIDVERDGHDVSLPTVVAETGRIAIGTYVDHRTVGIGEALGWALVEPLVVQRDAVVSLLHATFIRGDERAVLSGPVGILREPEKPAASRVGQSMETFAGLISRALFAALVLSLVVLPRPGRRRAERG
jgi:regulator of sigma E protease